MCRGTAGADVCYARVAVLRANFVLVCNDAFRPSDGTDDDNGAIACLPVPCQKITPRVLAERRHVASEVVRNQANQRAARILDQMADNHLTMDAEFRVLTINSAAKRGFAVQSTSLIVRTHWEAFRCQ